jgi:hypothetical protein
MARTRKPFTAKPGQPGSIVEFEIGGTVYSGQVWSLAPTGVWAFHADGLSGTTLVNVTVPKNGSPGIRIASVTHGGFRRCDAAGPATRCDFGSCRAAVTHHFHNGWEIRPVCKRDGEILTTLQPEGRLCETYLEPAAAAA